MMVLLIIFGLLVSLFLVWKGSNWITDSLIPIAQRLGTTYIAITTLLVSFIMSIPEMVASIYSFLLGYPSLGIGVIIGSVMANIGLTVGLSALLRPLIVEKSVAIRDGVYLIVIAGIVLLLGTDLHYTRSEGLILFALFIPYALNVWYFEKHKPHHHRRQKVKRIRESLGLLTQLFRWNIKASPLTFILGTIMILGGSYLFSYSLINIYLLLDLPEILVGITLGALGPALPNIATAVTGTLKGYREAAITETFGSNIFTLLITLGIMILLSPLTISREVFSFNLLWMIIIHLLMIGFIFRGYKHREESLQRYEGAILLLFYLILILMNVVRF